MEDPRAGLALRRLGQVSGQEGERRRLLRGEERVIVAPRAELHHRSRRERPGQRLDPGRNGSA